MQVETFEVLEMNEKGEVESLEECLALAKELDLQGQVDVLQPSEDKPLNPYRKMLMEEKTVYEAICSKKCDVGEYRDGPIPLRVLQVYQHALSLDMFETIRVWYCPNADIEDPVLVATAEKGRTTSYFILARWGEVLEPFAKMREIAAKVIRTKSKAALL